MLFGNKCPPLLCAIQVRDRLDYHKRLLEGRVTPALMINVLWRVHQDTRQFFNRCKKWEEGESLPCSTLQTMVASLVDNVDILMTLACPVADFLGPGKSTTTGTKAKKMEGTRGNHGWQPTQNLSIPPICQPCVKELKQLYPMMGIVSYCKKGKVKYVNVAIGGKGDCVNYGLLEGCTEECSYRHLVITVPEERQHVAKKTMTKGLTNLAVAGKASVPRQGSPTSGLGGRGLSPHPTAAQPLVWAGLLGPRLTRRQYLGFSKCAVEGPMAKCLKGWAVIRLYFSANWCQACSEFTPVVERLYTV